jgi:hypothetical protein
MPDHIFALEDSGQILQFGSLDSQQSQEKFRQPRRKKFGSVGLSPSFAIAAPWPASRESVFLSRTSCSSGDRCRARRRAFLFRALTSTALRQQQICQASSSVDRPGGCGPARRMAGIQIPLAILTLTDSLTAAKPCHYEHPIRRQLRLPTLWRQYPIRQRRHWSIGSVSALRARHSSQSGATHQAIRRASSPGNSYPS